MAWRKFPKEKIQGRKVSCLPPFFLILVSSEMCKLLVNAQAAWNYQGYYHVNSCPVAGPDGGTTGAPPPSFRLPKTKTLLYFGQNQVQYTSFEALDFKIVRESMPLDPSRAYKTLAVPAVVSIKSWKKSAPPPPPPPVCQFMDTPLLS